MTFVPWRKGTGPPVAIFIHAVAALLLLLRIINWFGPPVRIADAMADAQTGGHLSAQHAASRFFHNARTGRHDVRVYVYNLPPKFNTLQVAKSHQKPAPIRDPYCDENFYSAEVTVHRQLLKSSARTRDPKLADFFYVPIYVTCFLINNHPNNLTKTGMFFEEAMDYVTHKYTYFNSSQGRDHVFTFTQGFGARLSGPRWREWRNAIFLTHNGDFKSEEYTPRKDIVIPPDLSHYLTPVYADPIKRPSLTLESRKFLGQFGGQSFSSKISDHRGSNYSGGVRQYFASELYRVPGFQITGTRSDQYLDDIRNSMFCLAPEGWHPWSPRPYYGLLLGCVPVVLSDRQELAFEDAVPYDDVVVWVRPNDVFSLNNVLRSITYNDIMRRLKIMERIWPMFWYGDGKGAAMDIILGELSRQGASEATDGNSTNAGKFLSFSHIGVFTTSSDEPQRILATPDGTVFIGGTTSPLERGKESDLGLPLRDGLKREDVFMAKVNGTLRNASAVTWIYRTGTSKEDRLHSMLIDKGGKFLYVAGRTFGAFPGTSYKGLSDVFIIKYDVSGDKPEEVWDKPLVLGTVSSEAVLALAADPSDEDVIYATGFSSGNMFPGHSPSDTGDTSDAIVFSFSAKDASLYHTVQFGTQFGDHGTGIVISKNPTGPIFVSVVTDRRIGQYTFGNFHLYKFTRELVPLGDMLLRTFSREDVVGFEMHPFLSNSLIVAGSSWLDSRNENDVFVKRVVRAFDRRNINTTEVDIDEVEYGEYTRRLQSIDGSHDYTTGLLIDEDSGRVLICGHTGGVFAPGSSSRGKRAPFIASIDPNDGSLTDAVQMAVETDESWVEVSAISTKPEKDGLYYTFKVSNETSQQFYVTVGTFLFPSAWKERIIVKERPSPSPIMQVAPASEVVGALFAVVVGAACGGLALLACVIGSICWIGIRRRGKSAKVYDTRRIDEPSFMDPNRERPGPLLGPMTRGQRSSELV